MITPDLINSFFEGLGSFFVCLNIYTLHRDKIVKGVSKLTVLFFATWGYFNIYYYSSLLQWFSFSAGIFLAVANTIWISQMVYYHLRTKNSLFTGEKSMV